MTSAVEDNDGHEPTFKEAKDEFEFWLEHFAKYAEMDSCHFKWKYKKGREPDLLAYLILDESNNVSSGTKLETTVHQCQH